MVILAMSAAAAAGAVLGALTSRRIAAIMSRWPSGDVLWQRELRLHPRVAEFLRRRLHPGAWTGLALTIALVAITLTIAGLGILLAMIYSGTGVARADLPWARWAAERSTPTQTRILRLVSTLGGTAVVVAVAAAVAGFELWRRRRLAVLGFVGLTVGGQFAASNIIKWIVDRARPDLLQLSGHSGASFPSGHATAAAASFACFALLLGHRRGRPIKTLLATTAGAVTGAVAATRVLLGVHWVTDVLAGLVVGWSWFVLCWISFGGRLLRFGAPVEIAEKVAARESAPPQVRQASR
ncbi:MAG: phosphatase PAP2 family protein [Actinomycetes bacterium]